MYHLCPSGKSAPQRLTQSEVQELLENVADPKEFGKRGEPIFFGQLLLLALVFFPPAFFKVCLYRLCHACARSPYISQKLGTLPLRSIWQTQTCQCDWQC